LFSKLCSRNKTVLGHGIPWNENEITAQYNDGLNPATEKKSFSFDAEVSIPEEN